jgi:uncharacterized membrane protein YczE
MSEMINLLMKWIPDARDSIIVRVFLVLLSIAVTSVGVVFTVRTNIAPTAPDGLAAHLDQLRLHALGLKGPDHLLQGRGGTAAAVGAAVEQ